MTVGRRDLQKFLGRKNFKGYYTKNPLATTPAYAKFNNRSSYPTAWPIKSWHRQGKRLVDWQQVFTANNCAPTNQPFAENKFTRSNRLIGADLKAALVAEHANGATTQQLSFKYGIAVPRVDAVIRLNEVQKDLESKNAVTKEMKKMARHMRAMFDEIRTDQSGVPERPVDDLTEIPIPKEVQTQRFQSIAESEPFGPVDAAEILGIEPAAVTLEKLTQEGDQQVKGSTKKAVSFIAPQLEGERSLFRFTDAKVGNVGYRYGASRDDRKHARRVRFLPNGHMTYPLPEHS